MSKHVGMQTTLREYSDVYFYEIIVNLLVIKKLASIL
jgi:hypothetical protein